MAIKFDPSTATLVEDEEEEKQFDPSSAVAVSDKPFRVEEIRAAPTFGSELAEGDYKGAAGLAYETIRRKFSGLLGPTEKERSEGMIPFGRDEAGQVKYEYKPLGDRMEREAGLMTPFIEPHPFEAGPNDSGFAGYFPGTLAPIQLGQVKGAANAVQGVVGSLLSPATVVLGGAGAGSQALGRTAAGAFSGEMVANLPDQIQAYLEAETPQETAESGVGAAMSAVMAGMGAKHAIRPKPAPKHLESPATKGMPERDSAQIVEALRKVNGALPEPLVAAEAELMAPPPKKSELVPRAFTEPSLAKYEPPQTTADITRAILDRNKILQQEADQLHVQAKLARDMGMPIHPTVEERINQINQEMANPVFDAPSPPPTPIGNTGDMLPLKENASRSLRVVEAPPRPESASATELPPATQDLAGPRTQTQTQLEPTTTSTKNAIVAAEREARGIPPAEEVARRDFGTVWDEAEAIAAKDTTAPQRLVESLNENPRAVKDTENALLLRRQIELQNEFDSAIKAVNEAPDEAIRMDASRRLEDARDALQVLYDVNKAVGTETGRGLNARKLLAADDFSLAKMEATTRAVVNEGKPLTPKQAAKVKRDHARIEETERKLTEYETRERITEILREAQKEAKARKATGKTAQRFLEERELAARERVKKMAGPCRL